MIYKKIFGSTPLDITSSIEDGNVCLFFINLNNFKFVSIKLLETHFKDNLYRYNCLIYPFIKPYQSISNTIDSIKNSGHIPNFFTENLLIAIHDSLSIPLKIKKFYKTEQEAINESRRQRGDLYYKNLYDYAKYINKLLTELGLKKSEIKNISNNKIFI